jgi:methylmalonyl-CoA mutase N-terminal domain/subunit
LAQLRATPQNDILKEYLAHKLYIFPPAPAMRLWRDTLVFLRKHMPRVNITSIGGYHIREAGASREQTLAYAMAILIRYVQAGIDTGLSVDDFVQRFTVLGFGGSIEILHEIALHRAARRMYALVMKKNSGPRIHEVWSSGK